jgi:hypothetical protein
VPQEPSAPDYLPAEVARWADEHREVLERIVGELLASGRWPSIKKLTRQLAQEQRPVALNDLLWHMPRPLGFVETHPDRVVLLLFGLRLTSGGQRLLNGFANVLRLAVSRYGGGSEPVISRSDLAADTRADDPYRAALSEIILREAPFIGGGTGSETDDWRREITADVVRYWRVKTVDDYLRIRAEELRHHPQFGWVPASVAHFSELSTAEDAAADEEPGKAPHAPDDSSTAGPRPEVRDAFISHAGEDKLDVVRPLAAALQARGHTVWVDENELVVGDSLSESIDWGIAHSRFGVVVLSPAFFAKPWPRRELKSLTAREVIQGHGLLPIWHGIDEAFLAGQAPSLADKVAANTADGIEKVADQVSNAIKQRREHEAPALHPALPRARWPLRIARWFRRNNIAAGLLVTTVGGIVAGVILLLIHGSGPTNHAGTTAATPGKPPSLAHTYPETTGGTVHTWSDYATAAGSAGPLIQPHTTVRVACKLSGFKVEDGDPWWYRIASSPWNGVYYASADPFYNNGRTGGPLHGTPFVDQRVPVCQ